MGKDSDDTFTRLETETSFIAEAAARYGMPQTQLQKALQVVLHLIPEELALMQELSALEELDREHRCRLVQGLRDAVERYRHDRAAEDPLASVDDPMSFEEGVEALAWAELEAGETRARLLRQSISAGEAGRLIARTRYFLSGRS